MAKKEYFDFKLEDLQNLGRWCAECAQRTIYIYEKIIENDLRPRMAIEGILEFVESGKRTNNLRKLALDAYRSSIETKNEAAVASARSASLAAASAFTHPFKDINQARHILGPAAFSILASELYTTSSGISELEMDIAICSVNDSVIHFLKKMPAQKTGKKRIEELYFQLDQKIRQLNQ